MIDPRMTQIQSEIWSFLLEKFAGIEHAAPRVTILSRFNMVRAGQISDRDFREAVSNLVVVFKKPICTSPSKGYFVAKTEREKQEALHYLDSVLAEVGDRRRALAETDPLERQERLF